MYYLRHTWRIIFTSVGQPSYHLSFKVIGGRLNVQTQESEIFYLSCQNQLKKAETFYLDI